MGGALFSVERVGDGSGFDPAGPSPKALLLLSAGSLQRFGPRAEAIGVIPVRSTRDKGFD